MVFLGSHLLSIYYSVTRENFSVVSTENSVFYLLIFVKAVKIESSWLDLRPVSAPPPAPPPSPPPHHSFNCEWNLGPRRNQDGGRRICLFEACTFKCLYRLFRTSIPRLKRLTICWLICRRLAYFYVWKYATYATGKQHNVCWPRCKIEGRLSSSPVFDETL